MRSVARAGIGVGTILLCLGAGSPQIAGVTGPRIVVANAASGTIAEYDLQSQKLVEWSSPISPFGATGNAVVSAEEAAWFLPGNAEFFKLHVYAAGQHGFSGDFSAFAPQTGPIAIDTGGNLYSIDTKWNSVDEFAEVLGHRGHRLGTRHTGGGIGKGAGLPTHIAVDSKRNIWATANNATVTVFKSNQTATYWSYPAGTVFADAFVDPHNAAWTLYQSPTPTYFPNETSCTPVQSGPVTRYQIGMVYVDGEPSATLYGPAGQNPTVAHIVVDSSHRAYVSTSHQILDFDPGTQCPNDNLAIEFKDRNVLAPLEVYGGELFVADPVANSISAYAGGTSTKLWSISQPSGQSGLVSIVVR